MASRCLEGLVQGQVPVIRTGRCREAHVSRRARPRAIRAAQADVAVKTRKSEGPVVRKYVVLLYFCSKAVVAHTWIQGNERAEPECGRAAAEQASSEEAVLIVGAGIAGLAAAAALHKVLFPTHSSLVP